MKRKRTTPISKKLESPKPGQRVYEWNNPNLAQKENVRPGALEV